MSRCGFPRLAMVVVGLLISGVCGARDVSAQGLIWSLPQDGSWVRFEGEIKQTELRPDSPGGDVEMEWIQHVVVKSVGTETAEFEGEMVPCRWIEIVSMTGKPSEGGIDTGPIGTAIYKVLIPESVVTGDIVDQLTSIPVSFLPIVKGYRKIGTRDVETLTTPTLQVYPVASLIRHFETLQPVGDATEDVDTPVGFINSQKYTGQLQQESRTARISDSAEIWRSSEVPFGLAKWTFKGTRELKESFEPRDAFHAVTEISAELTVHETGMNAESELTIPE
ncbi:MAG: hypothetical protein O2955_17195 [Planctomycetota bacterium]|nr:hypothetical protein [Planctomycetota bacterium]MDA1214247.1 hypothetical protein [Planctomycetota bacterium]